MNLIPVIREALGLEVNEEFKLVDSFEERYGGIYRFTNDDFQRYEYDQWRQVCDITLERVVYGQLYVVEKTWKPKYNKHYYFVDLYCGKTNGTNYDKNFAPDNIRVNSGNCYRTREEAEKHVDEWMEKLYGKDWKELFK